MLERPERAIREHGAPRDLRSDNGPGFIAKAGPQRPEEHGVTTPCDEPGSPWQNASWKASTGALGTDVSTASNCTR
jgi:putative transposase